MAKYAKYASWLAKAVIAVAAVANFVMYFKTLENVYSAMFGSSVALLLALAAMDELPELRKRIGFIENRQKDVCKMPNDCERHVDDLTKTPGGDE